MPTDNEIVSEAMRILQKSKAEHLTLRLMGAIAFRHQCLNHLQLFEKLQRRLTDIDFASLSSETDRIMGLIESLGYAPDQSMLLSQEYGYHRLIYNHPDTNLHIDIFIDRLKMCHTIDLTDRLRIDENTISPSDLLLEKMQIVKINEKDVVDSAILLVEHDVGSSDNQTINVDYIMSIMSRDWGFYYTFTTNLMRLSDTVNKSSHFSPDEKETVTRRVDSILRSVEATPKTLKWKMRARVGTKQQWYNEVSEILT